MYTHYNMNDKSDSSDKNHDEKVGMVSFPYRFPNSYF